MTYPRRTLKGEYRSGFCALHLLKTNYMLCCLFFLKHGLPAWIKSPSTAAHGSFLPSLLPQGCLFLSLTLEKQPTDSRETPQVFFSKQVSEGENRKREKAPVGGRWSSQANNNHLSNMKEHLEVLHVLDPRLEESLESNSPLY